MNPSPSRRALSVALPLLVIGAAAGAALLLAGGTDDPRRGDRAPAPVSATFPRATVPAYDTAVGPYLTAHCTSCHGGKEPAGRLSLEALDEAHARSATKALAKIRDRVRAGEMPPKDRPRPLGADTARALAWIEAALLPAPGAPDDPGRVTLRRLNRLEWRNTIRDLLAVDDRSADDFPSDDVGYGFDDVGEVLSMPPLLLEKYVKAAQRVAERAVVTEDPKHPASRHLEADAMGLGAPGRSLPNGFTILVSNGDLHATVTLPRDGTYTVRARAYGQQAGPEPARMSFALEPSPDRPVLDVAATAAAPEVYGASFAASAGRHKVSVSFVNDFYDPSSKDAQNRDRNLLIDWVEVVGPVDAGEGYPESHRRVFAGDPGGTDVAARARGVLVSLASRAWRRPATPDDVLPLEKVVVDAVARGDPFERGVATALVGVLVSPRFLFHLETHPAPDDPRAVHDLDDFALAARLSTFLWSSLPDDALRLEAEKGTLRADLGREVLRMLKDPKAGALVEGFADQWLTLRRLQSTTPDPGRYPTYDAALGADMVRETQMFVDAVVLEDRPVTDFLDAPWTFLNERLARHYGIPGVTGDRFRRVSLLGSGRAGVLGQASVLTLTSYPTRTSPVRRGKWILEQLLNDPPPPPPPGAGDLKDVHDKAMPMTVRERMVAHRENPDCASCHAKLDPLGFSLEAYDGIGRFRTTDDGRPVDTTGETPDGRRFEDAGGLRAILRAEGRFPRAFAEKLLTYALGRGLLPSDAAALDAIVARARHDDLRFSGFVLGIVTSAPFQKARGEEAAR